MMIRREIQLPDQPLQWLLVSQVEHARLSGALAEHCQTHMPAAIRAELMQAITHHDDGWSVWEAAPRLDENGRPYSFRELQLEESLPIWTSSIEESSRMGPLSAWLVAKHFLALLGHSEKAITTVAREWQTAFTTRCEDWMARWQSENPKHHTLQLAEIGLLWLQLFDVMSLWLCSVCPGMAEQVTEPPESYHVGEGQPLETTFRFAPDRISITPWRFDTPKLALEASGWVLPRKQYASVDELLANRTPHSVGWQLQADD